MRRTVVAPPVKGKNGYLFPVILATVATLALGGCRQSFEYHNPLDPRVDASIAEILPYIEDPVIRQAVLESGARTRRELGFLWVNGNDHGGHVRSMQGIEYLSHLNHIAFYETGLPGTPAVGLSPLAKMDELGRLDFAWNDFGDVDIESIPFLPNLDFISFYRNRITDAASVVPLIEQYGEAQLGVNLDHNPIDPITLLALQPVLNRLTGLNVGWLQERPDSTPLTDLSFLVANDTITYIGLHGHDGITDWSRLSLLTSLNRVGLGRVGMDDASFQTLPLFSSDFNSLDVHGNDLTDLAAVADYIRRYSRTDFFLNIADNPFSAAALFDLAPALDQVFRLYVAWYGNWQDPDFEPGPITNLDFLPSNDTIHYFDVSGNDITNISAISRLRRLEELRMDGNRSEFVAGAEALLDLPDLQHLWISGTDGIPEWVLTQLRSRGVRVESF